MIWVPQTVDKGARAHTRHFKKSRKHRQTIQNTSIGTASSRADACMLAVFSGSEYPCTPIARRKRHRESFLGSLSACGKHFFDKLGANLNGFALCYYALNSSIY